MYRIDDTGDVIREIQKYLLTIEHAAGRISPLTQDGIYSENTREAVKAFQTEKGIHPTGEVDYITWTLLYNDYIQILEDNNLYEGVEDDAFTMELGDWGHPIIVLQSLLGELANEYPNIPRPAITGQFGLGTQDAVRAVQRNYGLYETGDVDKNLWGRMIRDYEAKSANR